MRFMYPKCRSDVFYAFSVVERTALMNLATGVIGTASFVKVVDTMTKERSVITREQQTRKQYTALEYVLSRLVAEIPVNLLYASMFTYSLKAFAGMYMPWGKLFRIHCLTTIAMSALAIAITSWLPASVANDDQLPLIAGIALSTVLYTSSMMNPTGIDPTAPKLFAARLLQSISPYWPCLNGFIISEFGGITFDRVPNVKVKSLSKADKVMRYLRSGDEVLWGLGLKGATLGDNLRKLRTMTIVYTALGWLGFQRQQLQAATVVSRKTQTRKRKKRPGEATEEEEVA